MSTNGLLSHHQENKSIFKTTDVGRSKKPIPKITLRTWLEGKRNWKTHTYIDDSRTRHRDPYTVLAMEPLEKKTAPTYNDIMAFIDAMLSVEKTNDKLDRPPQTPTLVKIIKSILKEHGF